MSRPLGLEFPGAWWHVTNRGVEQRDIFLDDRDRRTFVRILAEAVPRFRWWVHAFVLVKSPWDQLVGQIYLGSREFIARVQQRIDEHPRSTEHPRSQRVVRFVELEQITEADLQLTGARQIRSSGRRVRLLFAALARCEALASLSAIGSALGVGVNGASYLVKRAEELNRPTRALPHGSVRRSSE